MTVTAHDIYVKFKEQESIYKGKKLSVPKSIDRLSHKKAQKLQKVADRFNTIWQNIDIDSYIYNGFETWKTFSVEGLDNERLMRIYKSKDKKQKLGFDQVDKEDIKKSVEYINKTEKKPEVYCDDRHVIRDPIHDYVKNRIDCITFMFLVEEGHLGHLKEEEKMLVPYIMINYESIKYSMYRNYDLIQKNLFRW